MLSRAFILCLILATGHASGHGLEPSKIVAREGKDGYIRIRLNAWNRFQEPTGFAIELWGAKGHTDSLAYEASVPGRFMLGSMQKRSIAFRFKHDKDEAWICTVTTPPSSGSASAVATRICSKILIWRKPGTIWREEK